MVATRQLAGSGFLYTIATVAPILTLLLVTPFVTRILGPTEYGHVAIAITVYQLAAAMLPLGLPVSITRHAILLPGGSRAASGISVVGTLMLVSLAAVACVFSPLWGPSLFPQIGPTVLVGGVLAGLGLATVNLGQAILRADEKVGLFLSISMAAALIPPVAGFSLLPMPVFAHPSERYVLGLAAGYLLVGASSLVITIVRTPPLFARWNFTRSLSVGAPTLPHAMAVPALSTALVAIAAAIGGTALAGQLQTVVMLGSAVITVMNAVNNAWAPMVMKAPAPTLKRLLSSTTLVIALGLLILTAGYVIVAPYAVPLIGGPLVRDEMPVFASMVVAASGAFHVAYLANIHMTFISGRTWPLALTTPFCAAVALGIVAAFTAAIARSDVQLLILATAWPIFYFLQALASAALAAVSPLPTNPLGWSAVPLSFCIVMVVQGVVVKEQPLASLITTCVLVGVASAVVLKIARRAPTGVPATSPR